MIKYIVIDRLKRNEVIDFINEINNDFPIPVNEKINIEKYVDKLFNNGLIITAIDNNKIVAICAGYQNNYKTYTAYISILGVSKSYRKKGIGTNMINSFISEAKNNNMNYIMLETHQENFSAIKMYKKLNFVKQDIKANIEQNIVLLKKIN